MYEESCAINIGPRERARRMRFGITMYGASVLVAALLAAVGSGRWWRLGLLAPLLLGGYGVFQAREKT